MFILFYPLLFICIACFEKAWKRQNVNHKHMFPLKKMGNWSALSAPEEKYLQIDGQFYDLGRTLRTPCRLYRKKMEWRHYYAFRPEINVRNNWNLIINGATPNNGGCCWISRLAIVPNWVIFDLHGPCQPKYILSRHLNT